MTPEEKELRDCLRSVVSLLPSSFSCEQFHHGKSDRHEHGEECPPAARCNAVLAKAHLILERKTP